MNFTFNFTFNVAQEAVLNSICNWVNYHVASREDHFFSLLQYVIWGQVSVSFICDNIDKHPLYQTSPDAMFTIMHAAIDRQKRFRYSAAPLNCW